MVTTRAAIRRVKPDSARMMYKSHDTRALSSSSDVGVSGNDAGGLKNCPCLPYEVGEPRGGKFVEPLDCAAGTEGKIASIGLDTLWRGTAYPEKYGEPHGFFLMSPGENSGSCLGNTVTIAGDDRK